MANCSLRNLSGPLAAAALTLLVAAAQAQPEPPRPATAPGGMPAQPPYTRQDADMLRDFIHFVRINRTDVAAGLGRQLLARGLSAQTFVDLVDQSGELARFQETLGRAMRSPELEPLAAAMLRLYERGKLERVRDPNEIARNIVLLKGVLRARHEGRERLVAAGEYATPQLLAALLQRQDPELHAAAQSVLINLGQHAVIPLSVALPALDESGQVLVADVLGLIGYRASAPFLYDVLMRTPSPHVRAACERALGRLGGATLTPDPAALYLQLAEDYYAQKLELTSFPGEEYQLLWTYLPGSGLHMTAIRTEVYHEAMAMRLAERSLALRPRGNDQALALWLAANFKREIETPAGYENPAYGKDRREAMYYALAAGAAPMQAVLARALDTTNTPLARRAIAAIAQTAGEVSLRGPEDARRPLLEALMYPDRRVQYEAALALAKAQPTSGFRGSERVVPILASVIRDAGTRHAIVVATDREVGDGIRRALTRAGYTVFPVAAQLSDAAADIAQAPAIDLIVSNLSAERTLALVGEVRSHARLAATPLLLMTDALDAPALARRYERDPMVAVRPSGLTDAHLTAAAADLVERATGGPITPDEASQYAARALAALRDLAIAGNTALDVSDATLPLIAALNETTGQTRMDVAEVLARIGQKRAQVALGDAALNAAGPERAALLARVGDSARRFGNLLEPRQVERLVALARSASDPEERLAAAALVGTLQLPDIGLVPMILHPGG